MKNITKSELESSRPEQFSGSEVLDYVLRKLYEDKTKELTDYVVNGLTFEELIGALLMGKDLQDETR